MVRDVAHAAAGPATVGIALGTGAWLGLLDHPIIVSIISGVAVALIVAHVMAVLKLFRRMDHAEHGIEQMLHERTAAEERQERATLALLRALDDLSRKTEGLGVLAERIESSEEEIERLRTFKHDVEKSYSVTVSLFRQVTDKIDAVLARAK